MLEGEVCVLRGRMTALGGATRDGNFAGASGAGMCTEHSVVIEGLQHELAAERAHTAMLNARLEHAKDERIEGLIFLLELDQRSCGTQVWVRLCSMQASWQCFLFQN